MLYSFFWNFILLYSLLIVVISRRIMSDHVISSTRHFLVHLTLSLAIFITFLASHAVSRIVLHLWHLTPITSVSLCSSHITSHLPNHIDYVDLARVLVISFRVFNVLP